MCSFAGASVMSHHKLKPESRRRSFSHSPGGQGSEVKGSVRPRSPEGSRREPLLPSAGFWSAQALLGLPLHRSRPSLFLYVTFSLRPLPKSPSAFLI